jgi:hypothetical protein
MHDIADAFARIEANRERVSTIILAEQDLVLLRENAEFLSMCDGDPPWFWGAPLHTEGGEPFVVRLYGELGTMASISRNLC